MADETEDLDARERELVAKLEAKRKARADPLKQRAAEAGDVAGGVLVLLRDVVVFTLKVWVAVAVLVGILFATGATIGIGFRVAPIFGRSLVVFVAP